MAREILVLGCLAAFCAFSVAVVPPYIHICGRRNPNLDKCVLESVAQMMPKLQEGIPELDVPSLEPLDVEEIALANLDDFRAVATNVKLRGLSTFEIRYLKVDLKKQRIDIELVFPKVYMNSDYDVKAKILVPIHEKGPIDTVTDNVHAKAQLKFQTVERRGRKLLYFPTMTTKVVIKDYTANFQPGITNPISLAINAVLENSRPEIIESMTPSLEKAISEKVLDVANRICKHFTFDELFPDRE
ncbi:putative beta-carotene-binding protein [Trichogramma pretiosum]|uniref:putative beta-carotene-binding protein n=1 Tax=Trichogramma pretiosum TaxID=7493 RepID=UPI0006C9C148|nr:putative beta-carotene-binding protein [Trichogramma pretiosum]